MNKLNTLLLPIVLLITTNIMNQIPIVFFITGTSGSGKTTLTNQLKALLSPNEFVIYDFDENGVPENADQTWRIITTDFWLQKAQENYNNHKITIICGVSVPSEAIALINNTNQYITPFFGFIKIDDATIKMRLQKRGWNDQLINNNINWSHHLEDEVKKTKHHCIAEGSNISSMDVAHIFIKWILSKTHCLK